MFCNSIEGFAMYMTIPEYHDQQISKSKTIISVNVKEKDDKIYQTRRVDHTHTF